MSQADFLFLHRRMRAMPRVPEPTLFSTLVTSDDSEHTLGNVLIRANGRGVLLDADLVLADDSTHPIFEAP